MNLASDISLDGAKLNASLVALDTQANEPVQLKLLAWVMGLPSGLDPAQAARLVIMHQHKDQQHSISAALMRLVEIVAQYPQERLARMANPKRRALH